MFKVNPPARHAAITTAHGLLHLFMANDRARVRYIFETNPTRPPREWFILDAEHVAENQAIRDAAPEILAFVIVAHSKAAP